MKIHNVEQGSGEWLTLRLGIPTASMFHKIITPKKLEYSTQSRGYQFYLIAEKLLNYSLSSLDNLEWIARGKELEPDAVKMYEWDQDVVTAPVGFITTDDGRVGATPDRLLIDEPACLELKCPAPHTHVEYMIDGFGQDYMAQVQGQMLVGEFEWVDRFSYHPEMPPVLVRTPRDDAYIGILQGYLDRFCDEMDELLEKVQARGYFAERRRLRTAVEELKR
jgi:YqaJ-like viral recombinase domain